MAIPVLDGCALAGKVVTADALLTQRTLAAYLIGRKAHYSFTVKGNQPGLEREIALLFEKRGDPDFVDVTPPDHGRIETRRIWCSTALNAYLDFPHVGQVFMIERESIKKKPASHRVRSRWASRASRRTRPRRKRSWRSIAATGPSRAPITSSTGTTTRIACIRTGHGPENITRLRRFAVGILKSFQSTESIAEMMRKLCFNTRLVFDYLRMTNNSASRPRVI
ncbi:MAG: hypothetical protein IPI02_02400 [Sterolibacteriaceae bacterium]|nr:hypothetical protein [Sterolibacteriaceae bacterium]